MDDDEETFRHRQVTVGGSSLHVVEIGNPEALPFLFLHGWPESWQSWQRIMTIASSQVRAIAIDLPGVGESTGDPTDGSKRQLAATVRGLVEIMGLQDLTMVGQDIGGMITYAYLRTFPDLRQAVIMDVVIPGIDPWEQVLRNPYLWHFAFHAVPELPETLVQGHQVEYFDYFYEAISADGPRLTIATWLPSKSASSSWVASCSAGRLRSNSTTTCVSRVAHSAVSRSISSTSAPEQRNNWV